MVILSVCVRVRVRFSYLGEQCDDMNFANDDGCSNQCKKEPLFNCVGMSCSKFIYIW